jgi:hypothetical protein
MKKSILGAFLECLFLLGKTNPILGKCFMDCGQAVAKDSTLGCFVIPTSSAHAASLTDSCQTPDCDLLEDKDCTVVDEMDQR